MIAPSAVAVPSCRACNGALSIEFCDLGEQPLANAYVRACDAKSSDPCFPLEVRVCENCRLAQLSHVVDERAIFSDYAYLSSTSQSWLTHAAEFSRWAISRFALDKQSLVVEIASNDGYLLRNFVSSGIPCFGIEPAANVAKIAIAAGVPTDARFFGLSVADDIVGCRRRTADLIIANNVLAHVPDLNGFVAGLAVLAGDRGVISIEVPHLLRLIKDVQFDTIYHEHYAYWSLLALEHLFAKHGLSVFDVHRLTTHGGSLRIFVAAAGAHQEKYPVEVLRAEEQRAGLAGTTVYQQFDSKVRGVVAAFTEHLAAARSSRLSVACYGAAAKGNTFLNRAGLTYADLGMVGDANPLKQGTLLPGSRIPVVGVDTLLGSRPDEILILAWNHRLEIVQQLRRAGFSGGLVTAIPGLRIDRCSE